SHSGSSALTTRACSTRSAMTGIPSGRFLPPALGICTRFTGRGVQVFERYCVQLTSAVFDWGSSAVRPSTPAVLRPALISVTRRLPLSGVGAREGGWGRADAGCGLRAQPFSPPRPPHPACASQRTGRSTCLDRWSAVGGCRFRGPWGRYGVAAVAVTSHGDAG